MAARAFHQFWNSLHKKPVSLFAEVTFSSGTPTVALGRGIASIEEKSAGVYSVTLSDKYQTFLGADVMFADDSACPLTCFHFIANVDLSAKTLDVCFSDASKAATAPADTSTLYLRLDFDDSSAK